MAGPPAVELAAVRAAGGALDLDRLVRWHLRVGYRVKSFRCAGCRRDPACRGLPIQRARIWGLGRLRPDPPVTNGAEGRCEFTVDGDGTASLIVRNPCRNACQFCTTARVHGELGWETDSPERVVRTLRELHRRGVQRLRFVAFELLDHPNWPTLLGAARALGLGPLEVWTHGRTLAEPLVAQALVAAGVDRVQVPLFGADAVTHDRVAGSAGAFVETRDGLAALAALGGVELALQAVLVPDNLAALPALLCPAEHGVPGRLTGLALAEPSGPAPEAYRSLALDWEALQRAVAAVRPAAARLRAVMLLLSQVPTCVLRRAAPAELEEALAHAPVGGEPLLAVGRAEGVRHKGRVRCPLAARCALAAPCPGLFAPQLALQGTAGLEPVG